MTTTNLESREAIAERLATYRLSMGLNKTDFARRLSISEQSYGSFENATRDLTLSAAKKLRARFGLSLDFLYFGNAPMTPPVYKHEPDILPELVHFLAQKPKGSQKRILEALTALDV